MPARVADGEVGALGGPAVAGVHGGAAGVADDTLEGLARGRVERRDDAAVDLEAQAPGAGGIAVLVAQLGVHGGVLAPGPIDGPGVGTPVGDPVVTVGVGEVVLHELGGAVVVHQVGRVVAPGGVDTISRNHDVSRIRS